MDDDSDTAWGVDPGRGKVVVYADTTVPDPELQRITTGLARFCGLVTFERVRGSLHSELGSGNTIYCPCCQAEAGSAD